MANEKHLEVLEKGVDVWNKWREINRDIKPDLSEVNLTGKNLENINFQKANLYMSNFYSCNLKKANFWLSNLCVANFNKADLTESFLRDTDLFLATFGEANLTRATLQGANLRCANLTGANLTDVNLEYAILIETRVNKAIFTGCKVYGISTWNLYGEPEKQSDLIITSKFEPIITVDNLEIAQFIYLLLHSEKLRKAIDTISKKVVLILGRFTPERKSVLDALRNELRNYDYIPVLFDFQKPESKSYIETVSTLAHLARFIIADFEDVKIVFQEVQQIVPSIAVPIKPLLLEGSKEPSAFLDLRVDRSCFLKTFWYKDIKHLKKSLKNEIIDQAENKAVELISQKIDGRK